jgi:mRNA interferase YafQ
MPSTIDTAQQNDLSNEDENDPFLKDIQQTTRFKKDYRRLKSQHADLELLKNVITKLQRGEELESRYRNHQLGGKWKDSFDCHIQPDWVLIYRLTDDTVILQATGSHSDLFI